ncbi:TonB-dependent receptor [Thermonema rossianum]|uniref:TonB-dependent receptor n=1 Tax=Thermonema rossianum TaxID=55505 RepID=UPI00057042BA|nr:TonB-dependent receptor [Thermonema rossianum]
MKRLFLLTLTFCLSTLMVWAQQTGTLRGKVYDAESGETLIGATVFEPTTSIGTATDLDGNFELTLPAGVYTIEISYVSYQTKKIEGVEIKAGGVVTLNVPMAAEVTSLQEVVVTAKMEQNNESAILLQQKNASIVLDGVSAETFAKTGDRDAGAALRRITGVSVEGGRYVYVRGLGDRYSKATLNSAEIPSLDPSRNAVQFDMFPSNLLDNLVVYKTFSADLPGDFSGGLVNVKTKEFPEYFTLRVSSSYGYNTQATFNQNFLTYQGGKTDWLAFDDGTRAIPAPAAGDIPSVAFANNAQVREQLTTISRSFNKNMAPITQAPFLNQRHSFSLGNQTDLKGRPLGYIIGLSYQTDNTYYENAQMGRYSFSGGALRELLYADNLRYGEQNVLWGALANLSYKMSDNHKLSLNLMRNQSGTKSATYFAGRNPQNFDESVVFESRVLNYMQRSLTNAQLKGEHYLPALAKARIEWHTAYTLSNQEQPDLRMFANDYTENNGVREYSISPSVYAQPTRFYRDLNETNIDNKLNVSIPYKAWGNESKLKVGVSALMKDRSFRERRLTYRIQNISDFKGDIDIFLADENLGIIEEGNGYTIKTVIQDDSEKRNQYDAQQQVWAAYVMTDLQLSPKWKINAGLRIEKTYMTLESLDPSKGKAELDNLDPLPAVNVIYSLRDNMNLRASYSRTLARPTFRELAPFASFDFIGDFVLTGNPNLRRTLIDNFDLRWEMFPRAGELISVSAFYKQFDGAIERALVPQAQNTEFTFRNVDNAFLVGTELEIRKALDFISPALRHFQAAVNASYIYSQVDIPEQEYALIKAVDPSQPSTRPFFAQSPYLVNAILNYNNEDKGFDASASLNVFGPRLMVVSAGATPNVYEQPRPVLNITLRQRLGANKQWAVTARGSNLLNPEYRMVNTYNGREYPYQSYRVGQTFTLGVSYTIE